LITWRDTGEQISIDLAKKNLIVSGLQEEDNETEDSLRAKLLGIFSNSSRQIKNSDVDLLHRIPPRRNPLPW